MGKGPYYSKILLFGEYAVICNSMGLTIPYPHFSANLGYLDEADTDVSHSNTSLQEFWTYLDALERKQELIGKIDLSAFKQEIADGLVFPSTIPQGFGVGSSGALTAAVYDRYRREDIMGAHKTEKALGLLKKIFAQMESYFHGVSSGLDPLNCFIRQPLLIHDKSTISLVDLPNDLGDENAAVFLIDTGAPGKTGPLVNLFFEKCRKYDFYKKLNAEFIPMNNSCIQSFVAADFKKFYTDLEQLSGFLLTHFEPMIPRNFIDLWKKGLEDSSYLLKLCGSGGGGFLLGFTKNYPETKTLLENQKLNVLRVL